MRDLLIAILAIALAAPAVQAQNAPAAEANRVLTHISDAVISGRAGKPMTRSVVHARGQSADLAFNKQSDLTNDLIDRYLSRGISHFLPWDKPERSRQYLQYTGTKYIHWSHLLWSETPPDWKVLCAEIDAVHGSDWGADVVYEAGVMECIYRAQIDSVPIPDWLYKCMEELGINKTRKPGPKGPRYFSYENMFDRTASDWPARFIGLWAKDAEGKDIGSAPDITMTETQLWYAMLIAEYVDAGFEGIFFGQIGLTGGRDKGNECTWEMCQFAKRMAAGRGYRHAVFLSTHHWEIAYKDKPVFTHMSWPSRMFCSSAQPFGMECGLNSTEDGQHISRTQFQRLLAARFDLPILIEIDNYGKVRPISPMAANSEGDDEITAYMKKPHADRAAFLGHYYHEFPTYKNALGKCRVHLAPSGERCGYIPYKESQGEEEVTRELFREAAAESAKALFAAMKVSEWKPYQNKARSFSLRYPAGMQPKDRSAEVKPKAPGSFWVAFSDSSKSARRWTINVRRSALASQTTPEQYAKSNTYLAKWERVRVNGADGFRATTGTAAKKDVTYRAVLVDGRSAWVLSLMDASGGDPKVAGRVFDFVTNSLNTGSWKLFASIGGQ